MRVLKTEPGGKAICTTRSNKGLSARPSRACRAAASPADEEIRIESRRGGDGQQGALAEVHHGDGAAGGLVAAGLDRPPLQGVRQQFFGGPLQLEVEREHEVAAGAGLLRPLGAEDAAGVIGQLDGHAAAAAEQRLVLPFDARAAHQLAGTIVAGRCGRRFDRSQIAQHVGGQRRRPDRSAARGGRSSRRGSAGDGLRFPRPRRPATSSTRT